MKVNYLPHKFILRDYQMKLFNQMFNLEKKYAYIVWHRRAGKDKTCWNILISKALQRSGNYFYIFPELGQGRKAIWLGIDKNGIKFMDHIPTELIKKKHGRSCINDSEMRIELINGSTIQIVGTDKGRFNKLVGTGPVGMVFSEYALQPPLALKYLNQIIQENNGWIIINTTPRGHNHAYKLFQSAKNNPDWYVDLRTIFDTRDNEGKPIVTDAQIQSAKTINSIEEIRQEYICDWDVALSNAYFSKYLRRAYDDKRIKNFPIDTSVPVSTFWDLGISDAMSIFFVQFVNQEVRCVNYYENNNYGLEHYINKIYDWRDKNGVIMDGHYAPHDIKVRELGTGLSRQEQASKMGFNFIPVKAAKHKQDNIELARTMFSRVWIHETNCRYALDCLMQYHANINSNGLTGPPSHDWSSHCADAYMLIAAAESQCLLRNNRSSHGKEVIHRNKWLDSSLI